MFLWDFNGKVEEELWVLALATHSDPKTARTGQLCPTLGPVARRLWAGAQQRVMYLPAP